MRDFSLRVHPSMTVRVPLILDVLADYHYRDWPCRRRHPSTSASTRCPDVALCQLPSDQRHRKGRT